MKLGKVLMTKKIASTVSESTTFANEILECMKKYINKDWGCLSEEDKQSNEEALENSDRILAAYQTSKGKVWIITEWDRSYTTILFSEEY